MIAVRLLAPQAADRADEEAVWRVLRCVDGEFVPPLSARRSTTTKDLGPQQASEEGPVAYMQKVLGQVTLLAALDGEVVGLLSFRHRHEEPYLHDWSPSSYVSTIGVLPTARGHRVGRRLYESVLNLPPQWRSPFVSTRTWSQNDEHLHLLASLGFAEVLRLPNDRGVGIDTVYYARAVRGRDGNAP